MRFTNPAYLLLLIPIFVGLYWSYFQVQGMAKRRKIRAFILRGLICSLLILALSGPEIYRPNKGTCTVFLVDRSDSIRDKDRVKQEEFIDEAMSKMPDGDEAAIVVFGGTAAIESSPGGRRTVRKIESRVDGSTSDLAGAVRLASAVFPEGKAKRIVLLSDGNETQGDLRGAAQVAALDNISIDTIALGQVDGSTEALISSVEMPDSGHEGQPFDIKVDIDSHGIKSGKVRLDREGVVVAEKVVDLHDGRNTIIFPQTIKSVGLQRYRATLEANNDTDPRNNLGAGFINVRGRPKILIAQDNTTDQALATALQRQSIAVDLVGPSNLPTRPEQYQAYDSIILNDINAANVPDSIRNAIVTASKDSGIGLAMVGGENSFLPGGWYGTNVTEALPVDLNIRQKKSLAAASVLIIADCSGSMGAIEDGQPKVRLASRAAEETIKMLGPMDRVGVAGSSDGIDMVVPMQSAENKEAAIDGARKLAVNGGGIYIRPSINKAFEVLSKEPSKTRHFVLLADGADSTDWDTVYDTAITMRALKITTSVVAIGDGEDVPALKKLAAIGGGRFYLALKASQLPAIFTQDTAVMSRSAIEEGAFVPKITQMDEAIQGVFDAGSPPLLAYCLTESKPLSKVLMKTKKDDPLLMTGRNGLASTFAFTSDAKSKWASRWVPWDGFGTFWSQLVRSIGRQATRNNYQIEVKQDAGKAKVVVTGRDPNGNPLNAPETPIRIGSPDGSSKELILNQTGPGVYESEFDTNGVGSYVITVVEDDGKGGHRVQTAGASVSYPAEYRILKPNTPLLAEASAETKGRAVKDPSEIFRPVELQGKSLSELWPTLLLLAILVLPFDIATRRVVVPLRELLATGRKKAKAKKPVEDLPIAGLKRAKKQVQQQTKTTIQRPQSSHGEIFQDLRPTAKSEPTPEPVKKPEPPKAETGSGSTAGALLAKKRKRSDD
ncbi:MAG: VWA domain-containing protein [Armatimonadetes bacterium]|nr:VWA domain-containing protein [Armatimonadota bacterium]